MSRKVILAALSVLGIGLCQAAFASYAIPDEDIGTGVIQTVNYATHSVTVAGHVYTLSNKTVYISANGDEVLSLQPGMHIRFIADGPIKSQASKIVNVVVLPPESQ
ncbi:MAG: hypothetical protein KGL98_04850 [Gammaproteobacteria bacterium]|nr:hypothetical protein [Gammaproteobacteria bacterium]MBU6510063.1 hypothetical protein [Gammaproteobacteria bacterium]MDE1983879.1 hypothetical protein [Gammaproteobacteria bacterium]MDE2107994.1 hypothetical protein [Gammaproteobacteria bacterium]MDE2460556.1 hypothetical protein [Gammaproteobacteria bacterium]